MAKTALFRSAMFGYHKSEVNEFIAKQNERNLALKKEVAELEARFEQYRRYYESLLQLHQENLAVLREMRVRASKNAQTVRDLQGVFESICASYQKLDEFAKQQQQAVLSAKVYEEKALKYESLANTMREMVLQKDAPEQTSGLPELELPQAIPEGEFDDLMCAAEDALGALNADASAFFAASDRFQIPGKPENETQDASSL